MNEGPLLSHNPSAVLQGRVLRIKNQTERAQREREQAQWANHGQGQWASHGRTMPPPVGAPPPGQPEPQPVVPLELQSLPVGMPPSAPSHLGLSPGMSGMPVMGG